MKKIFVFISCLYFLAVLLTGCAKWTEAEQLVVQRLDADSNSLGPNYKKYLEGLKSYKQTVHPQVIGFFDAKNWKLDNGKQNTFLYNLPDSLDMICTINQEGAMTPAQMADMASTRGTKGTRMLLMLDFKKMNDAIKKRLPASPAVELINTTIDSYTDSVLNVYQQNKYDGFYLLYEDLYCFNCSDILSDINRISGVITRLAASGNSKKLLLQSKGTDALFLTPDAAAKIDFFVVNSLNVASSSYYVYDGLLDLYSSINGFSPSKMLLTASFQGDRWKQGGDLFPNGGGTFIGTVTALARWNVNGGRKGGLGIYYIEQDYNNNPPYKYAREAIQLINPSIR